MGDGQGKKETGNGRGKEGIRGKRGDGVVGYGGEREQEEKGSVSLDGKCGEEKGVAQERGGDRGVL